MIFAISKTLTILLTCVFSQMTLNPYDNYQSYDFRYGSLAGNIILNPDATEIFIPVDLTNPRIVRLNVADPLNIYQMGEYTWNYTVHQWAFVYSVNGFLIASSSADQNPNIFNLTTFDYLGQFSNPTYIISGTYIASKDIFVFGNTQGHLAYFDMATFPVGSPAYVHNETMPNGITTIKTIIAKSSDEKFLAVTYQKFGVARIFNLTDWTEVKQITMADGSHVLVWSLDNRYLLIYPYSTDYLLVYDRDANWTLSSNVTIGYLAVSSCVVNPQTNLILCTGLMSGMLQLFTISLYDFEVIYMMASPGERLFFSENHNVVAGFAIYFDSAMFFSNADYCSNITRFDAASKVCVPCDVNCVTCQTGYICQLCAPNYQVVSGTCQLCGSQTFYNALTLSCENCLSNCDSCASSSTCNLCVANYNLVSFPVHSCVICPQGQIFDSVSFQCGPFCTENCKSCWSLSECAQCQNGYSITANKTCMKQSEDLVEQNQTDVSTLTNEAISFNQAFDKIMKLTLENTLISQLNKIPASRVLIPQVFAFLINIDHLWLYIYHKRDYGEFITKFLLAVRKIEDQKWIFLQRQLFNTDELFNLTRFSSKMDFKINQTSYKFVETQNTSSQFFVNTLEFFVLNVPLVFITFFILRKIFRMTSKHRISVLLREYAFKMFIICMLIEGNMESFSYFFIFDCVNLNSFNFWQKALNLLTLLLFAAFLAYIIVWYFLVKLVQRQNSDHFFRNYHTNNQGLIGITLESSVLNFSLGACHVLLQNYYNLQLKFLLGIEIGYLLLMITFIRTKHIYRTKYTKFQNILACLLRIGLISTFSIDQQTFLVQKNLFQEIQMLMIIFYLANWLFSMIIGYLIVIVAAFNGLVYSLNGISTKKHVSPDAKNSNEGQIVECNQKQASDLNVAPPLLIEYDIFSKTICNPFQSISEPANSRQNQETFQSFHIQALVGQVEYPPHKISAVFEKNNKNSLKRVKSYLTVIKTGQSPTQNDNNQAVIKKSRFRKLHMHKENAKIKKPQ